MRIPTALRAAAVLIALAFLALAWPAAAGEESRLSVVLDASGALSLQLEGPGIPAAMAGPWRTDRARLAEDIRRRLPRAGSRRVHFRGSPDASYRMVLDVLNRLTAFGFNPRIILTPTGRPVTRAAPGRDTR